MAINLGTKVKITMTREQAVREGNEYVFALAFPGPFKVDRIYSRYYYLDGVEKACFTEKELQVVVKPLP